MRKILTLSYVLLIAGFACIAHAQLTQTGAGKIGSGGGGGFVPCAGTAIHVLDPNNLSTANWMNVGANVSSTFTATDPNLVANNATDSISGVGGGSFNAEIHGGVSNVFSLTLTTTYAFGAYFKSIVAPPWVLFRVSDVVGGLGAFGAWFNIATNTAGGFNTAGTGTATCARAGAAGNGYSQVSFAGSLSATNANMAIDIFLVDGNGTGVTTLGQDIYAWQVSP